MHVHYCMGERVGVSLSGINSDSDTHECPKCGMKKAASKKGCCEDEHVVIKAKGDAAVTQAAFHVVAPFVALLPVPQFKIEPRPVFRAVAQAMTAPPHGPPLHSGPRLHLRHCVFLI